LGLNASDPSKPPVSEAGTDTGANTARARTGGFLAGLAAQVRASRLRAIVIDGIAAPAELESWLEEAGVVLDDDEASPRHADLLVLAGRPNLRTLPVVQRVWQQMPDPKWLLVVDPQDADATDPLPYAMVPDPAAFLPADARCASRRDAVVDALAELRRTIAATDPPGAAS